MKDTSTNQSSIDPDSIEAFGDFDELYWILDRLRRGHNREIDKDLLETHQAISNLITERLIEELESIRKAVVISETEDDEFPYWCETCHMMLQEKDDLCGCEYAIRDRLSTLKATLRQELK